MCGVPRTSFLAALAVLINFTPSVLAVTLGVADVHEQGAQQVAMQEFRHSASQLSRALGRELVGKRAWNGPPSPADRAKLIQSVRNRLGDAALKIEASDSEAAALLEDWAQEAPPSALLVIPFDPMPQSPPSKQPLAEEIAAGFGKAAEGERDYDAQPVQITQVKTDKKGQGTAPQASYSSYSRSTVVSNDGNHATTHTVECRNGKCTEKKSQSDVPGALRQGLLADKSVERQRGEAGEHDESDESVDKLALAFAKNLKNLRGGGHWFGFSPFFNDPFFQRGWFSDFPHSNGEAMGSKSVSTSTVVNNGRAQTRRTECLNGNCRTSKMEKMLKEDSPRQSNDEVEALAETVPEASLSKDELIDKLQKENAALRSKLAGPAANIGTEAKYQSSLRRGKP